MKHMISSPVTDSLKKRAILVQRGGARAAVLGVNDGLVSTLCLVVGVAGAGGDPKAVLTAGLAGLLAGATSMAAGEWISVKSQVDLLEGVLSDLKSATKTDRPALTDNLAHALAHKGMDQHVAHEAAADIAKHDKNFMSLYSSQVIGLNQDELGSPWNAAISSFLLFMVGAVVPLLPWMFGMSHDPAIILAITLTGLAGLFVGGFTSRSSGKNITFGALRQLGIVLFSAAATYGIGLLFGMILK
ncbi:MAG: VIT1/CCC1 transporter family protein [Candidatus Saccharimonadales bacterium]